MSIDGNARVMNSEDGCVQFKREDYFELKDRILLPELFRDIYKWFAGRLAPKAWRYALSVTVTAPTTRTYINRAREFFFPIFSVMKV